MVEFEVIKYKPPEGVNVIVGISHFIKTVEDFHEILVNTVPGIKFGLAFCEASGKRLIRHSGTDETLRKEAIELAKRIGAGHSFVILLGNAYPINVLTRLRNVPELVSILCATANPIEIIVAKTEQGRAIVGIVDGMPPVGVEGEEEIKERKEFLRKIGYKF